MRTVVSSWTQPGNTPFYYARPVGDSAGEVFNVEGTQLTKRDAAGALVWARDIGSIPRYTVGQDQWNGVHVGADDSSLTRYDSDGNLVWTLNLPAPCDAMVLDAQGNRFISFGNGVVARLGSEPVSAPFITSDPKGQTVLTGSDVALTVSASGSTPLRYHWLLNGTNFTTSSNATLTLNQITPAQGGTYSVMVSNFLGSATSAPALLRVKAVAIYLGNQLLTNGTYVFATSPTFSIHSGFTNGSIFYTLDGSAPSFTSTSYSSPFTLSQSAAIRAVGYSADFLQSEEADAVNATVLVNHALSASASAGGSVNLNPPGGTYVSSTVVTATAVPAGGWSFLYWLGDATGGNPVNISMERDKTVHAVFGTALGTTVAGNGQILLDPPGGLYPFGTVVRLTGQPQPGNYFGFWGNAATGNANPLYYSITSASPTVSSIFGATPSGQAALTVLINGSGQVNVNPRANVYPTNQSVTLTAVTEPGREFVNWTGDADGIVNPLILSMTQSKVITANFTSEPLLRVDRPGLEGFTPTGFRLTVVSDPPSVHQILGSTNLSFWEALGAVTNNFGEAQFTDGAATNLPRRFYKTAP